jgi:16S rRNA (adenine1518-N6/adenine1519-N6)-dimethyltransferase
MNNDNNKFKEILPLNKWVEKFKLQANKSFGQNFLFNLNITDKIVELSKVKENDCILEVGPGLGPLTISLLNNTFIKKLYVIEKDLRFSPLLDSIKEIDDRININFGDALKWKIPDEVNKIIANLPYNISVIYIIEILKNYPNINEMVLLVQKEVAERFISKNNNKTYGRISILSQIFYDIKIIYNIPPSVFVPSPKVQSSLLFFKRKNHHLLSEVNKYEKIIKFAFQERRKLLKNTLGVAYPQLSPFLENKRCENLTINDIINFGKII